MNFTMIKNFAGVPVSNIRHSGGYRSLTHDEMESISPSFLLPTLHNFSWKSPAAATCIAAVPANEPMTLLGAHDGLLRLRRVILLHHLAFHRINFLARIHRPHHAHYEIHPQVTNRLSIAELLSLILLANFSLNVIGRHVLTRTAFVPFFVGLLVDIHSGLNLPWGYDKILPFGMGGQGVASTQSITAQVRVLSSRSSVGGMQG